MVRRIPWAGFLVAAVVVGTHLCFERYMYDAGIDWSVQLVFFASLGLLLLALSEPAQRFQPATGWLLRWGGGLILATLVFMLGFFRYWQGDRIRYVFGDHPERFRLYGIWLAFFMMVGMAAVLIPYFIGRGRERQEHWPLVLKLATLFIAAWASALMSDFLYPGAPVDSYQSGYYRDDAYFISGMILPVLDWFLWSAWCLRLAFAGAGKGRKAVTALGTYGLALGILVLGPAALVPAIFAPYYLVVAPFFAVPLLAGAEIWRRRLMQREKGVR